MTQSDLHGASKLKRFDFTIDFDFNFDQLLDNRQLIELFKYVRPHWTELNCIKYNVFTEGSTNRLIGFSYSSSALDSDSFLLRIYGRNTELFINREYEIDSICELHNHGLCSAILACFENGICYSFTPGRPLCKEELREIGPMTNRIARELARLHSISFKSSDQKVDSCLPMLFRKISSNLKTHASKFNDILNEIGLIDFPNLDKEMSEVIKLLYSIESPIVFCHNDLLMKNIIFDEKLDQVRFIDFEYSAFNFQSFDLANHFCEYSGQVPFEIDLYPSKTHQMNWIREYLRFYDEFNGKEAQPICEKRIEKLYIQTCKSSLASHLLWGAWSLLQSQISIIDFDFVLYAKQRLGAYLMFKRKFLEQ